MLKIKINMATSGIHLMRTYARQMIHFFAEHDGLHNVVIHITEVDQRLNVLFELAKETFHSNDDSVTRQNYQRLIKELRSEVKILNNLSQINLEEYPALKEFTQEINSKFNEILIDINRSEFDNL